MLQGGSQSVTCFIALILPRNINPIKFAISLKIGHLIIFKCSAVYGKCFSSYIEHFIKVIIS